MTEEEMIQSVKRVDGLAGMTVNERLFVSGLLVDISLKLTSAFRGKLTTCFAGEELYKLL